MVNGQTPEPGSEQVRPSPTVGTALRTAREASGLSVDQVSAVTKIRATLVRDLEADHFESSGGDFYVRGHLRSISAVINADAADLVACFDREAAAAPTPTLLIEAAAPPVPRTPMIGTPGAHSASRAERHGPNWGLSGMAAVAVLVGLVVIGSVNGGQAPSSTDARPDALSGSLAPTPSRSAIGSASATVVPPAPDAVAQKPVATGAELRVRIIGSQSWVSVSNGAGRLFEGVLGDGQFKDFQDPTTLKLVVGNAGSVSLVCGGKDVGQAGDAGRVKRFTCNAAGLVAG